MICETVPGCRRRPGHGGSVLRLTSPLPAWIGSPKKRLDIVRALGTGRGNAGDSETEGRRIARIQVHEKTVWMLKSYLG